MAASQLYVFDDEIDSKSKWVKKLITWLCCPNNLVYLWFRSVMLCCCAICWMIRSMQSECAMPQLKELEQLKLSSSAKSATADQFITKNLWEISIECWDHHAKIQAIS